MLIRHRVGAGLQPIRPFPPQRLPEGWLPPAEVSYGGRADVSWTAGDNVRGRAARARLAILEGALLLSKTGAVEPFQDAELSLDALLGRCRVQGVKPPFSKARLQPGG